MKRTLMLSIAVSLFVAVGAPAQTTPAVARVKGFSVVLVQGGLQEGPSAELPAPARAAIADLKDFLPFKSYQLLDAAWMLGSSRMTSRLRAGDRDYAVSIVANESVPPGQLQILFTLRDPAASGGQGSAPSRVPSGSRLEEQQQSLQALYAENTALRTKYDDNHPLVQENQRKVEEARQRLALAETRRALESVQENIRVARGTRSTDALIDATFFMRVGETVVVGTSRVNGERALIALMTAVPK